MLNSFKMFFLSPPLPEHHPNLSQQNGEELTKRYLLISILLHEIDQNLQQEYETGLTLLPSGTVLRVVTCYFGIEMSYSCQGLMCADVHTIQEKTHWTDHENQLEV